MLHLLLSATPTPTPTPTPTGTASSVAEAASDTLTRIQMSAASTSCSGDVSICGLVSKATGSETAGKWTAWATDAPLRIAMLVLLALVIRKLLHLLIRRLAKRISDGPKGGLETLQERLTRGVASPASSVRRAQRAQTLGSVLSSAATAGVFTLFGVMILDELGFPIAPLITSAGVLGVAIGFGAQSLVKDVVTGVFLLVEDQYGVGDVVDVGSASGTIEAVGLRVTRLRDVDGTVWYVRNGEILKVGNHSQGWSRVVMDVGIEPATPLAEAEERLLGLAGGLKEDPDLEGLILGDPEIWGITELTNEKVTVRLVMRTRATRQTVVAAALRERLRDHFEGLVSTADGAVQPATAPD